MMFEMFESLIIEISQPLPWDALGKKFLGDFFVNMKILISTFGGPIANNKENRRKQLKNIF